MICKTGLRRILRATMILFSVSSHVGVGILREYVALISSLSFYVLRWSLIAVAPCFTLRYCTEICTRFLFCHLNKPVKSFITWQFL